MVDVSRGKRKKAWRMVIHGGKKVGKTSLAAGAPGAVFISGEGGEGELDCARVVFERYRVGETDIERHTPRSWTEFKDMLSRLAHEGVPSTPGTKERTLVLDGFGDIEALCARHILETVKDDKGRALASLNAQWGTGDAALLSAMREAWVLIENIWERQTVNIILTCHSRMNKGQDERGDYVKLGPALNSANRGDVAGWLAGWVDVIGYIAIEAKDVVIGTKGAGDQKVSVHSRQYTERRLLHLAPNDGFEAGCRFRGVDPVIYMPNPNVSSPWDAFWAQVQAGPLDEGKVRAEFKVLLAAQLEALSSTDPEKAKRIKDWAAKDLSTRAMWQFCQQARPTTTAVA